MKDSGFSFAQTQPDLVPDSSDSNTETSLSALLAQKNIPLPQRLTSRTFEKVIQPREPAPVIVRPDTFIDKIKKLCREFLKVAEYEEPKPSTPPELYTRKRNHIFAVRNGDSETYTLMRHEITLHPLGDVVQTLHDGTNDTTSLTQETLWAEPIEAKASFDDVVKHMMQFELPTAIKSRSNDLFLSHIPTDSVCEQPDDHYFKKFLETHSLPSNYTILGDASLSDKGDILHRTLVTQIVGQQKPVPVEAPPPPALTRADFNEKFNGLRIGTGSIIQEEKRVADEEVAIKAAERKARYDHMRLKLPFIEEYLKALQEIEGIDLAFQTYASARDCPDSHTMNHAEAISIGVALDHKVHELSDFQGTKYSRINEYDTTYNFILHITNDGFNIERAMSYRDSNRSRHYDNYLYKKQDNTPQYERFGYKDDLPTLLEALAYRVAQEYPTKGAQIDEVISNILQAQALRLAQPQSDQPRQQMPHGVIEGPL